MRKPVRHMATRSPEVSIFRSRLKKSWALYKPPTRKAAHPRHRNSRGMGICVAEILWSLVELLDTETGLGENLRETNRLIGVDHGRDYDFES